LTDGCARPFLGVGAGLAWLGANYALANQVGWHLIDYPETKAHAPFVVLAAGIEIGGGPHPWTLGAEAPSVRLPQIRRALPQRARRRARRALNSVPGQPGLSVLRASETAQASAIEW